MTNSKKTISPTNGCRCEGRVDQPGKACVRCQPRKANVQEPELRVCYERHLPHQVPPGYPIFLTWNLKGSLPQSVMEEIEREKSRLSKEPARENESASERKVRGGKMLFAMRDRNLDSACAEAASQEAPPYVGLSSPTPYVGLSSRTPYVGLSSPTPYVGLSSRTGTEARASLEKLTYNGRPMWLRSTQAAATVVESIVWGVPLRYALYAYAVMGNHVHVLLTPAVKLETITQGIKGYTAFQINQLQQQRGRTVWQGESYDHWARDEEELYRIIEYIENNPVSAGLCRQPEDWPWSSAAWRTRLEWKAGEPFLPEWKNRVVSA